MNFQVLQEKTKLRDKQMNEKIDKLEKRIEIIEKQLYSNTNKKG